MDTDIIDIAVEEAIRFIDRADEARKALRRNTASGGKAYLKEIAAMKRASMDLTRALADLRKRPSTP